MYLYKNGNEYSGTTGGWKIDWQNGGNAFASKSSSYMQVYSTNNAFNNWSFIGIHTRNKINLSGYKKLVFVFDNVTMADSGHGGFDFALSSTDTADHESGWYGYFFKSPGRFIEFTRDRAVEHIGEENICEMDISDLNDSQYVYVSLSQGTGTANNIKIKEVYLTKEESKTTGSYLVINPNGGSYEGSTSEVTYYSNVTNGNSSSMTISVPTRAGYTFKGWQVDSYILQAGGGNGTGGIYVTNSSGGKLLYPAGEASNAFIPNTFSIYYQFSNATKDVLNAIWERNIYTLTINTNGGEWNGSTNQVTLGGPNGGFITNITAPVKEGYTFTGWTLSGGGTLSGTTYTFGSSNATLTANYRKNYCTINTSSVGSGVISNSSEVTYKEDTSIFIIPAEGYSTTSLRVDGVSVTPVESYDFLQVTSDHTVDVTFTMTQTRKMQLLANAYEWIDLNLD